MKNHAVYLILQILNKYKCIGIRIVVSNKHVIAPYPFYTIFLSILGITLIIHLTRG